MKRAPRDLESAKHWLAFLRNHRETIAAMGFLHDSNDHVSSVPRTMAQVPGHRSTLAYQLTHVDTGEPFPSPDGKQFFFEITIERREHIFIMKTDGTSQKQITHDPANHDSPSWTPDGAKIAFVSDANEHSVIYMMNIDGTNVERLTDLVADSIDPTWSADSSKVIYCADDDLHPPKKNASDIFSVDVKTKQVATLISGGTNTYPS